MKNLLTIALLAIFIANHSNAQNKSELPETVIIENEEELDEYIGQMITIKGEVSNTKIPQIIGVDVASDDPDLRGELALATGILEKWIVTEDEVDNSVANRGAGIFYRLAEKNSGFEVQVKKPD